MYIDGMQWKIRNSILKNFEIENISLETDK